MDQLSHVRAAVLKIIDEDRRINIGTDRGAWDFNLVPLDYLKDLSPENLRLIRLHTEIITGEPLNPLLYSVPASDPEIFAEAQGYNFLTAGLPEELHIGEPALPAPLRPGCSYRGKLLNHDLIRYQMYVGILANLGVLDAREDGKAVFMEVGPGYGALPHHLLTLRPGKITCVLIDLPIMLLASGAYIATNNPDARMFIYDPDDPVEIDDDLLQAYDVVLIPNYRLDLLEAVTRLDAAFNSFSLQEMTETEANGYLDFIRDRLKGPFCVNFNDAPPYSLSSRLTDRFNIYPQREYYDRYREALNATGASTLHVCARDLQTIERAAGQDLRVRMPDGAFGLLRHAPATLDGVRRDDHLAAAPPDGEPRPSGSPLAPQASMRDELKRKLSTRLLIDVEAGCVLVVFESVIVGRLLQGRNKAQVHLMRALTPDQEARLGADIRILRGEMHEIISPLLMNSRSRTIRRAYGEAAASIPADRCRLVNMGCGDALRLGWLNVDFMSDWPPGYDIERNLLNYDLRFGLPLPDGSAETICSRDLLERLTYGQGVALARDSLRVLKPGGRFRAMMTRFRSVFRHYLDDDRDFYDAVIADTRMLDHMPPHQRTYSDLVSASLYEGQGDKYMWDEESLVAMLLAEGYREAAVVPFDPALDGLDSKRARYSFFVEARP